MVMSLAGVPAAAARTSEAQQADATADRLAQFPKPDIKAMVRKRREEEKRRRREKMKRVKTRGRKKQEEQNKSCR
jgi:hypothetical protein